MVILNDFILLRIGIFLVVTLISAVMLDRSGFFRRGISILLSLIIGTLAAYYSTLETDFWNIFFYSWGGFLILTGISFLIFFFIVASFPSSGLRRACWVIFGVVMYFLAQQNNITLPDFIVILIVAIILVMILCDRWIVYWMERRRTNSWLRRL